MLHVSSISQGGQKFYLKNGWMCTDQYPQQTSQKEFGFAERLGLSTFSETKS